jgi:hypothetical protein
LRSRAISSPHYHYNPRERSNTGRKHKVKRAGGAVNKSCGWNTVFRREKIKEENIIERFFSRKQVPCFIGIKGKGKPLDQQA